MEKGEAMTRKFWKQEKMKDHHVKKWDKITTCGRDSLKEELNQTLDWDLVTCGHCLKRKGKEKL